MIVIDTNVVSAMMQPNTAPGVMRWLDQQPAVSIWLNAVSLYEIRYGLNIMPDGRKRRLLTARLERLIREGMGQRVLDFEQRAATTAADIAAKLRRSGLGIDVRDLMIAGIAGTHHATLATRNTKHFAQTGIALVNPWDASNGPIA